MYDNHDSLERGAIGQAAQIDVADTAKQLVLTNRTQLLCLSHSFCGWPCEGGPDYRGSIGFRRMDVSTAPVPKEVLEQDGHRSFG